jgi:hypothetical protein
MLKFEAKVLCCLLKNEPGWLTQACVLVKTQKIHYLVRIICHST